MWDDFSRRGIIKTGKKQVLEIKARDAKFVFTHWSGSEEEMSDPGRRGKWEKEVLQKAEK